MVISGEQNLHSCAVQTLRLGGAANQKKAGKTGLKRACFRLDKQRGRTKAQYKIYYIAHLPSHAYELSSIPVLIHVMPALCSYNKVNSSGKAFHNVKRCVLGNF